MRDPGNPEKNQHPADQFFALRSWVARSTMLETKGD
jgi:hypothetical protein